MKFTQNPKIISELPTQEHFAALVNDSITEGNYGDYNTIKYMNYLVFEDKNELEKWILENHGKKTFKVVNVKPLNFELKSTVII